MPSHPERVRRNYHEIKVAIKPDNFIYGEQIIIHISKATIASSMRAREIEHNILRAIHNGIFERYND